MPDVPSFDHTSIAVRDASRWARWVRRELGGTVIAGEVLPDFRYVLFHVGDEQSGSRLELMDARTPTGFLGRFLDRHGERPHHLTFVVPDLEQTVRDVRRLGLAVVNVDLGHPPWREAFVMPDTVHGCVLQLADSTRNFPPLEELLRSQHRDTDSFPGNRGAVDPTWWDFVWEETPQRTAAMLSTTLASTDPELSGRLFGDVLGGTAHPVAGATEYRWGRRVLRVRRGGSPGIDHLTVSGGPDQAFRIGSASVRSTA